MCGTFFGRRYMADRSIAKNGSVGVISVSRDPTGPNCFAQEKLRLFFACFITISSWHIKPHQCMIVT
jgi:hypothetical protein